MKNEIETIDASTLRTRIGAGDVVVIDARAHPHGKQIVGAIRYKSGDLAKVERINIPIPRDGGVVVYGADDRDEHAEKLAARLREQGYAGVALLAGGIKGYEAAGGDLEELSMEQPVVGAAQHEFSR